MQNCLYLNRVTQKHNTHTRARSRNSKDEAEHEHENEKEAELKNVNGIAWMATMLLAAISLSLSLVRALTATEAYRRHRRWNVWFLFIECVQSENRKHCFMS